MIITQNFKAKTRAVMQKYESSINDNNKTQKRITSELKFHNDF